MYDTGSMRRAQRVQNAQSYFRHPPRRQGSRLIDEVSQGTAAEQFHDDPWTAVVLDDIVDGDNTGMVKPTRRTGLLDTPSTCQPLLVLRDPSGEDNLLDGNVAVQGLVVSAPDNAHPAVTDGLGQAVPSTDQPIDPL